MSAQLSPTPVFKGWANDGTPLAYGLLSTYAAGTTTPQATYVDSTQGTPNTNPVVLNARGECALWLDPTLSYKFNLTDLNGNQIPGYPVDNINGALNPNGSIIPSINNTYTLGSPSFSWANLYLGPNGAPAYNSTANIVGYYGITPAEIAAGATPTNYAYPPYTLLRYGADPTGLVDSTAALQAAINSAAAANHAMVLAGCLGAKFKISSGWSIDVTQTGIDFQGAFINAAGFTTGNWCSVVNTAASDVTQRQLLSCAHPIQNATWQGPGVQNTTAVCQYFNDTNAFPTVAGVVTRNIGFQDWGIEVLMNAGTYCNTWEYCLFGPTVAGSSGPATVYGIQCPAASDAGERNRFVSCTFYDRAWAVQQANPNGDLYFEGCSFDYAPGRVMTISAGNVFITNPHIESNTDTDYWFYVTGTNSGLSIKGGELSVTLPKTAYSPLYSDSSVTNNGISLDDVFLSITSANSVPSLCAGTGIFTARNLKTYFNSWRGVLSLASNTLAYGGFESANYTAEWTLSTAVRSNAQAHTGTYSLSFPSTSVNSASAIAKIPCKPGAMVQGVFWYLYPTRTNGTLTAQGNFYDAGGNVLADTIALNLTAAQTTWAQQSFTVQGQAPPGAAYAGLSFLLSGVVTGTETAYVDDVVINVTNP